LAKQASVSDIHSPHLAFVKFKKDFEVCGGGSINKILIGRWSEFKAPCVHHVTANAKYTKMSETSGDKTFPFVGHLVGVSAFMMKKLLLSTC
jgi:hypothetical protein